MAFFEIKETFYDLLRYFLTFDGAFFQKSGNHSKIKPLFSLSILFLNIFRFRRPYFLATTLFKIFARLFLKSRGHFYFHRALLSNLKLTIIQISKSHSRKNLKKIYTHPLISYYTQISFLDPFLIKD